MSIRAVKRTGQARPALEGAGVKLNRVFGFGDTSDFDPFLMMDDFRSDRPEDYLKGFPWHPHRGIETITYVLAGTVEHGDSLGNRGTLGAGDVQWMTAGSGILHQEMPKGDTRDRMHGFQLWANLPASLKMTDPRYQDIPSREIVALVDDDGTVVRVICGDYKGKRGPFGVLTEREAADGSEMLVRETFGNRSLVVFDSGDEVTVEAGPQGVRFLLVSGRPIREPVAWHGPIVMNTEAELRKAVGELRAGTFIKHARG